jgi:hypothetical protein
MKKFIIPSTIILTLLLGLFAFTSHALAVEAPATKTPASGQALEIGPPVINLTANPGETVKAQISLRDISSSKLLVTNEINDFVADGENGVPKILLDEKEANPYSIKAWISPLASFTLVPKQVQTVGVTVQVPATAAPGGYYGVIRFTGTPPDLDGTGVSLSASLGALVLLRVNGNVTETLSIEQFGFTKGGSLGNFFETAPTGVMERLKNTGNIHEQPVGQVDIKDMFGNVIETIIVNNPSPRNILPSSIRKLEQKLDGNKWLFGLYTATLTLNYGLNNEQLTATTTFWVIPYTLIAIILIALIAVFFILRFALRRYNQSILKKAGGGSRRRR